MQTHSLKRQRMASNFPNTREWWQKMKQHSNHTRLQCKKTSKCLTKYFEAIHWEDWPSLTVCEDLKDCRVQEQLCLAGCTVINVCIDAQVKPYEPSNNIQQLCWNSKSQQFSSNPQTFQKSLTRKLRETYTSVTWEMLVVVFATHVMPVHAGGPHGSLPCQFDNFPCPETIFFLKASRAAAATKKKTSNSFHHLRRDG